VKVLVDTNVLLDVVLDRKPWVRESADLLSALDRGTAEGFVAGHALTTVYYFVARQNGPNAGRESISDLLDILEVVPPSESIFRRALSIGVDDFEDAVHIACALRVGCDTIATRNLDDFERGGVVAEYPSAILARLNVLP
jgi:predicted nucleic acid-binding protein